MFASAVYRRCADELAVLPGMELTMLTVSEWRMNGRLMPFDPLSANAPYATVIGGTGWTGFENRGFYRSGLRRAFQISQPEVLFLMEEPFSIFAAQILAAKSIFAPRIPVVFFTWNNLSLHTFDYRPSFFYRNVARFTLPRMDYALTANSDGIQVLHEAGFQKPIRIVGYGVDTGAFEKPLSVVGLRDTLTIHSDDIVIGYVGRMITMKGVDLLIDAFAQLKSEYPERQMKLLLIGSGEDEAALMSRARSLGITNEILHIASVSQSEVPAYMQLLDILVLPSRRYRMWAEQFGRVLVEAMAARKIVIGSSSGAIPEVIGDAGLVFAENDYRSLALQIDKAISMGSHERADLLARAKARAEYFSWQRFSRDAFDAMTYTLGGAHKKSSHSHLGEVGS